jgi:hypothetical protein
VKVTVHVSGTRAECQATAANLTGAHLPGLGQVVAVSAFRPDGRARPLRVGPFPAGRGSGGDFVDLAHLAALAGVAPSTLRAYISRGEADVPPPDLRRGAQRGWSPQVATGWARQRRTGGHGRIRLTIRPTPGHDVTDHPSPTTAEEEA